jgi:hypothetical protein
MFLYTKVRILVIARNYSVREILTYLLLQIKSGASKKLYDMIDVLREGNMR